MRTASNLCKLQIQSKQGAGPPLSEIFVGPQALKLLRFGPYIESYFLFIIHKGAQITKKSGTFSEKDTNTSPFLRWSDEDW